MFVELRGEKSFIPWCALVACCLIGCQPSDPSSQQAQESHEHFPPHWPHTIFHASDRLSELLEKSETASSGSTSIAPHQEIIDLVGWLPILAADSDLDRSTFDRIDTASNRIQKRWQQSREPQEFQALVEDSELREIAGWLADICQRERPSVQQLDETH